MNFKAFIFENKEKVITIKAYIYSFFYRYCIKHLKMSRIEHMMGERGKESACDENDYNLKYAKLVAFHANRVTEKMPWEEKCLPRSLTIARILKDKGIDSTIYLGVAREDSNMSAHSWIRCGNIYLSDPMTDKFTVVAKFKF